MIVNKSDVLATALGAFKASFGDTAVHLIKAVAGGVIDPNGEIAQFTESDFTGYTAGANIPLIGPVNAVGGGKKFLATPFIDVCTDDGGDPQNVIGYYLTFEDQSELWMAELFDEPVPMVTGQSILVAPEIIQFPYEGTAVPES